MNEEGIKPAAANPEDQESLEISPEQGVESPEDFHEQIVQESEGEVATFTQEGESQLAQTEARAEAVGLTVDPEDKEALQTLGAEAAAAQAQLVAETAGVEKKEEIESPAPESNTVEVTRDHNFEGSTIFKTKDEGGREIGYALRRNSNGELEGNKIGYMYDGSIGTTYQLHESDFEELRQKGILESYENIPKMKERVIENPELLDKKEASKEFFSEERTRLAQEIWAERKAQREKISALKANTEAALVASEGMEETQEDRQYGEIAEMQSGEANKLSNRLEVSSNLNEQDIIDERENISQLIVNSEGVASLKTKLQEHYLKADEVAKEKYESVQKSVEQTALRNGVFFVHTIQERETLRHNELSNVAGEATYEDDADILLSLEPTISASSVFSGRSENGNVSGLWSDTGGFLIGGGDIRYADRNDLDSKSVGIKERIAAKGSEKQSVADIDKAVSKRGEFETMYKTYDGVEKQEAGTSYNEFIIQNPKIFGYFQPVGIEEDELFADGKYWAGEKGTKYEFEGLERMKKNLDEFEVNPDAIKFASGKPDPELYKERLVEFQQKISKYKERFEQMAARGNALYIMTPDRSVYEYLGINNDGSVQTGAQLTPEEVATGRAGLPPEKRKELGERVLEKRVFKQEETIEEAREIVSGL